jgi:hypothetical protein
MGAGTYKKNKLNNFYAWGIAILPLATSIPPAEYFKIVIIVSFIILIALVTADNKTLRDSGYTPPLPVWGIIIVPVYLWKRANVIGSSKLLIVVWIAALGLSLAVDSLNHESSISDTACPLVTKIIKESLGDDSAQCVKVKVTEKLTDSFYKATASLNNGNDINITIEEKGDMIYVRIPPNYLQQY